MHYTEPFATVPNAHFEAADGSFGKAQARQSAHSTPQSAWPLHLQLGLEDLLGDLLHARRSGDLGRLALLSYCEVRRWARMAGDAGLAEHSSQLITQGPHASRENFLAHVDALIGELERVRPGPLSIGAGPQQN
jgi:hypothetical protein